MAKFQTMDELRSKFLNLVKKQNQNKIPTMGFSTLPYEHNNLEEKHDLNHLKVKNEPDSVDENDEIQLESIEDIFYEESAEITQFIIKRIESGDLCLDKIEEYSADLKKKQKLLSKKLLKNISDQKSNCNSEFQNIITIQEELSKTLTAVQTNRAHLQFAKQNLTTISLKILAAYRKREKIKVLVKIFNAINNIRNMDINVQNLLSAEQYPEAISLLLKCKMCITTLPHYNCVTSLDKKLQETLLMSEFEMEKILYKLTESSDLVTYKKLHKAYALLNKSMIIMDQLHLNFISAIHVTYLQIIKKHCNISNLNESESESFENVCEKVSCESYFSCLVDICKSTWKILNSYHHIVSWHNDVDRLDDVVLNEEQNLSILDKLNKGKTRIWNDVKKKLCILLQCNQFKNLKYEQFVKVLSIMQTVQKVGLEFCEDKNCNTDLVSTIENQSIEFFENFHAKVMNEIILFFENESWLPVEFSNFLELQEFSFIRQNYLKLKSEQDVSLSGVESQTESQNESQNNFHNIHDDTSNSSQDIFSCFTDEINYFIRYFEKGSPFDSSLDIRIREENFYSKLADENMSEICKKGNEIKIISTESSEENLISYTGICANNTSINILRNIGKYLQICKLLPEISTKVITSILELFDFYAFFIHEIFCKNVISTVNVSNIDLEIKLKHIEENIILKVHMWSNNNFQPIVKDELENTETLNGLVYRIVAIQSGLSMVTQFQDMHPFLCKLFSNLDSSLSEVTQKHLLFFEEISKLMYLKSISRILDSEEILTSMSKIKWDLSDISTQHSFYVDILNRNCQTFAMKLEEISKIVEQIPYKVVWNCLVQSASCLLVEGYSNVKKCTPGGRALMQLDFTHFISMVELISKLKFENHRSYVQGYIKAYYLPLEEFIIWINTQKETKAYSCKQLTSIVNCIFSGDRKTKTRLIDMLEETNVNAKQN